MNNGTVIPLDMVPPPPPRRKKMMMHMTFYWGKDALVLFTGWPGTNTGMYVLALVVVFFLAFIVEWLNHCDIACTGSRRVTSGLVLTVVHALRMGLAYMVMLAVMSFNVGIFLVAIAGHFLGFFLFRVLKKPSEGNSTLPSMAC